MVRPRPRPAPNPPRRGKIYQHELEDMKKEKEDDGVDFSKLSIQDIIYIKSLMGERRPAGKRKKKILCS